MLNVEFHLTWLSGFIGNVILFFHEHVYKNLHKCNQNIFKIFLWKITFLARRAHVSEINRHFFPTLPNPLKVFYAPTDMILAILCREVPHMLPAKYQPNQPSGYGEEVAWMVLTLYGHERHTDFKIVTCFC